MSDNRDFDLYNVQEKLASLESMILSGNPGMKNVLRDIHRELKSKAEIVTLLSEEEIATLIEGLKKVTGVEVATTALKSPRKKALKNITLDDL